jgi:integrase
MSHKIHLLDAQTAKNGSGPKLYDGGGLYLNVAKGGSRSWIFRYMLAGKSREVGLGSFRKVGLKAARQKAAQYRELLGQGIDPKQQRDADRAAHKLAQAKGQTFDQCAEAYIEGQKASWSNSKHADQWTNTLAAYASPHIGQLPIQDLDTGLILKCLEPIWTDKTETATRVRGRIESVIDWAAVRGYRNGENPARWRGHLDKVLPKPGKVAKVKHHPALSYEDLPEFIEDLELAEGTAARALELTIYTAARSNEVLKAEWSEFDLGAKLWTIPAERMKAKKEHRVPLSGRAMKMLRAQEKIRTGKYVFPSPRHEDKHLSNMAMTKVLQRLGHTDITVHGFRSTFRDWAAEKTNTPNIVAEAALAHVVGNKAEAAYRRGDLFAKRVRLMDNWAKYTHSQPAEVVSIGKAKA